MVSPLPSLCYTSFVCLYPAEGEVIPKTQCDQETHPDLVYYEPILKPNLMAGLPFLLHVVGLFALVIYTSTSLYLQLLAVSLWHIKLFIKG